MCDIISFKIIICLHNKKILNVRSAISKLILHELF